MEGLQEWLQNSSEMPYYLVAILFFVLLLLLLIVPSKTKKNKELEKSCKFELQEQKRKFEIEKRLLENDHEKELAAAKTELRAHQVRLETFLESNLTSIPWLAGMMADYLTYDLEIMAKSLDWGRDVKRLKKVESIREIRKKTKAQIQAAKEAIYQLEYLKTLYPGLEDVLATDYKELNFNGEIPECDPVRGWMSREEWLSLPEDERNQLALDRYVQSRKKSKWQIGRDYELAVAYEYSKKGYAVDTFGDRMGMEDLGRDLIATHGDITLIIQCKYWSQQKTIHEKHLFQLYGTTVTYMVEHPEIQSPPKAVFVTNTGLSDVARKVAKILNISVVEHHKMADFPRIKCNIGRDDTGPTHIYHLPMDAQYDITQIKDPGEFYAFTVKEAVDHGFRRAYKWHGTGGGAEESGPAAG